MQCIAKEHVLFEVSMVLINKRQGRHKSFIVHRAIVEIVDNGT